MTPPMTPREKVKLKPCPFCGGYASMHDGMGEFWVRCDDCGASGSMRSRLDRAERDWNDRSSALASGSGDHAELIARLWDRLDDADAFAAASVLEALLAENAALRAELGQMTANHDIWTDIATERLDRATEAERKLAEARSMLLRWRRHAPTEALEDLTDAWLNKEAERG